MTTLIDTNNCLPRSLGLYRIQTSFADSGRCSLGPLLLSELFFKLRKLMHRDFLLRIHDLLYTLDLFDLVTDGSVSKSLLTR
jgi:hypothetical protein